MPLTALTPETQGTANAHSAFMGECPAIRFTGTVPMLCDARIDSIFQLNMILESGCPQEMIERQALQVLRRTFNHLYNAEVPLSGDGFAMSTLLVAAGEIR